MNPLTGWQNFYVIVGSAAGALIGLQFVVLSLVSQMVQRQLNSESGRVFSTPTIIHFGAVLLVSASLCAPWPASEIAGIASGSLGVAGIAYAIHITRRMRVQTTYKPEFEDWLFHASLPLVAYTGLVGFGAFAFVSTSAWFGVAASVLVLLFSGIHNAWDAVTYHVFSTAK